jgi:hypothetical protein
MYCLVPGVQDSRWPASHWQGTVDKLSSKLPRPPGPAGCDNRDCHGHARLRPGPILLLVLSIPRDSTAVASLSLARVHGQVRCLPSRPRRNLSATRIQVSLHRAAASYESLRVTGTPSRVRVPRCRSPAARGCRGAPRVRTPGLACSGCQPDGARLDGRRRVDWELLILLMKCYLDFKLGYLRYRDL